MTFATDIGFPHAEKVKTVANRPKSHINNLVKIFLVKNIEEPKQLLSQVLDYNSEQSITHHFILFLKDNPKKPTEIRRVFLASVKKTQILEHNMSVLD